MEFRSVGGPKKYVKYSECTQGDVLALGTYKGRGPTDNFGKQGFEFESEDGVVTSLNHCGSLERKIEVDGAIAVGQTAKVVYAGKILLEKGPMAGKEAHTFDLFVADTPVQETLLAENTTAPTNQDQTGEMSLASLD